MGFLAASSASASDAQSSGVTTLRTLLPSTTVRALRFRIKAARQHPGLRWYVTIENSETSAIEAPQKTGSRRLVRDVNGKKRFHPLPHQTNGRQDGERRQSRSR